MLNRAIMMGRLCADPELKHTQTQVAVCSFRIAVDRDYSKNGDKETDFFDVVAWRTTAEFICKYFTTAVMVSQRIGSRRRRDSNLTSSPPCYSRAAAAKPVSKSARMSSMCSVPMDRRMVLGLIP